MTRRTLREPHWSDAIWIAEGDNAKASKHRDARIRALDLFHHATDSCENILLIDTEFPRLLQVVREDVEEELRVRGGVDMSMRGVVHELH